MFIKHYTVILRNKQRYVLAKNMVKIQIILTSNNWVVALTIVHDLI